MTSILQNHISLDRVFYVKESECYPILVLTHLSGINLIIGALKHEPLHVRPIVAELRFDVVRILFCFSVVWIGWRQWCSPVLRPLRIVTVQWVLRGCRHDKVASKRVCQLSKGYVVDQAPSLAISGKEYILLRGSQLNLSFNQCNDMLARFLHFIQIISAPVEIAGLTFFCVLSQIELCKKTIVPFYIRISCDGKDELKVLNWAVEPVLLKPILSLLGIPIIHVVEENYHFLVRTALEISRLST